MRGPFKIVSEPAVGQKVEQARAESLGVAEFRHAAVKGKGVMVIVPAVAARHPVGKRRLYRANSPKITCRSLRYMTH